MRRRDFLGAAGLVASSRPRLARVSAAAPIAPLEDRICVFTDHLDDIAGLEIEEVSRLLQPMGVTGPDLTVRPGGLIAPERVAEQLPRAARVLAENGLTIPMITTGITSSSEAGDVLATAARLGIDYYKLGYMRYEDMDRWRERRERARADLARLVALGESLGIHAGFHNHSGPIVGGTIWDCLDLVEPHDPRWLGVFFDISHATIEGGKIGWEIGFRRARPRITMVAFKDFVWERVAGEWQTRWVRLGQGMVPLDDYLRLLVETDFAGPVSLHIEYDPGGATRTERIDRAVEVTARDLDVLRDRIRRVRAARV